MSININLNCNDEYTKAPGVGFLYAVKLLKKENRDNNAC